MTLVHTDWISSEHSDFSNVVQGIWKQKWKANGVGSKALKLHELDVKVHVGGRAE